MNNTFNFNEPPFVDTLLCPFCFFIVSVTSARNSRRTNVCAYIFTYTHTYKYLHTCLNTIILYLSLLACKYYMCSPIFKWLVDTADSERAAQYDGSVQRQIRKQKFDAKKVFIYHATVDDMTAQTHTRASGRSGDYKETHKHTSACISVCVCIIFLCVTLPQGDNFNGVCCCAHM